MNIKCLAPQKEDTRNDVRDALTITQWLEEGGIIHSSISLDEISYMELHLMP
jgi:hypothetical protein